MPLTRMALQHHEAARDTRRHMVTVQFMMTT